MINDTDFREETQRMVMAAHLYYELGHTQQEVARLMGISRPTVSRLLDRARESGVVTITITNPFDNNEELSHALCKATGLDQAVVCAGEPRAGEISQRRLGISAAQYLEKIISGKEKVGVGWGRALYSVVQSLSRHPVPETILVPLLGGLGQISPSFQVNELIRVMAKAFECESRQFYVPAIVSDEGTKQRLLESEDSAPVTGLWDQLDIALVGIGNVDFDSEMKMLFEQYLDNETRQRLVTSGAAGDICMHFYDREGRPIQDGLRGVISATLVQVAQIPNVIAVAGGVTKAHAILGAIRGGFINTLITDDITVKAILSILGEQRE